MRVFVYIDAFHEVHCFSKSDSDFDCMAEDGDAVRLELETNGAFLSLLSDTGFEYRWEDGPIIKDM